MDKRRRKEQQRSGGETPPKSIHGCPRLGVSAAFFAPAFVRVFWFFAVFGGILAPNRRKPVACGARTRSNPFLEGHGPQVGKPVDGRLGSLRYLGWQGVGRFHYERSGLDVL